MTSRNKIDTKSKSATDRPTDGRTDRPMDEWTDKQIDRFSVSLASQEAYFGLSYLSSESGDILWFLDEFGTGEDGDHGRVGSAFPDRVCADANVPTRV